MTEMVESYKKFNYALRPSKQVERLLLVEGLLKLGGYGYPVSDYTYLGFGSVYYADFLVFNRYLYIDRMICVEGGEIPRRMRFNKPLGAVDLRMDLLANVIPNLDRRLTYFAWLDYDVSLDADVLGDVRNLLNILAPGSIILVTVDAEARVRFEPPEDKLTGEEIQERRAQEIDLALAGALDRPFTSAQYNNTDLPERFAWALSAAMSDQSVRRGDIDFLQLFNFSYRDGAQMLTVGGLVDTPQRVEQLRASAFMQWPFLNETMQPLEISVPPLTPREKAALDRWVTMEGRRPPLPFEMEQRLIDNFTSFRRYYPQYFETIV